MTTDAAPDHAFTDEQRAFWTDGACVVRGAVPFETIEAARVAVAELEARGELADLSAMAGSTEDARFRAGVDHWPNSPTLAEIATRGVLPRIAAAVLGTDRLFLYEDSVLVKDPGTTVETHWHTDDGYFHVEGRQLATMWVPLDPAPQAAGALRFVRGSFAAGTRYRPTLFVIDDPIPGTEGDQPPELGSPDLDDFGFDLALGDLTIHHACTLHSSGGNATASPRRVLSLRYCGTDAVVQVKPGAPMKAGFDTVAPGTPLAAVADRLGVPEAVLDQ